MPLITDANLIALSDHTARVFEEFSLLVAPAVNLSVLTGPSMQAVANQALGVPVNSQDYNVETDLDAALFIFANQINASDLISNAFVPVLTALNLHYSNNSPNAVVGDLPSYLVFVNNPSGSSDLYITLMDPWFQDWWTYANGVQLDVESVQHKPIHPSWRSTLFPNTQAMGQRAVGGAFVAGYSCLQQYGSVNPTVEVTANFTGGSAPPTVTLNGADEYGNAVTWTANVTGGNNPVAAVSTTITPPVLAMARQTLVVGSLTGIVAGSVLTVNAGLPDQEIIMVESVNAGATTITAVFRIAHTAAATLTGQTCWTTTQGTAGSRARSITNITIGITGHAAGTVRVTGLPTRIAV